MATKPGKPGKPKKVWKGERHSGPAPARHIPWPEIFKHHISVVEGHTKMLEMVQKHTVNGTGNYTTITNLVKRGHEMFRQARDISRSFVPPAGQREMVPLGSSSESMYPGYSPADIEYGKAAAEVGQAAGEMKARGEKWELPADGPEYKLGQAHGAKRRTLRREDDTEGDPIEDKPKETSQEFQESKEQENTEGGEEQQYFVIDTNPTPVDLPNRSSKKRAANDEGEDKKEKKEKKKKKEKDTEDVIETDDISAEVEARLKAKKEKAKAKEEKKRKRESTSDEPGKVLKKSKKEKSKKREVENGDEDIDEGEERKKSKKRKATDDE